MKKLKIFESLNDEYSILNQIKPLVDKAMSIFDNPNILIEEDRVDVNDRWTKKTVISGSKTISDINGGGITSQVRFQLYVYIHHNNIIVRCDASNLYHYRNTYIISDYLSKLSQNISDLILSIKNLGYNVESEIFL